MGTDYTVGTEYTEVTVNNLSSPGLEVTNERLVDATSTSCLSKEFDRKRHPLMLPPFSPESLAAYDQEHAQEGVQRRGSTE